ncbi:MAG: transposase [Desulfobacterales bacterium]|nr:transposase [Desulfobacterales bacterium]
MHYRRSKAAGGTYFFTVNLADRTSDLLVKKIDVLRQVIRTIRHRHPFTIVAMVVLPDHLHSIWRLPPKDADYPIRWSLIKAGFSRQIPKGEPIRKSRKKKGERGIWQRRYWEHRIRDEKDLGKHVDYIHFNPVKHGFVTRAVDWRYSSIHRFIAKGWLMADWGAGLKIEAGEFGE